MLRQVLLILSVLRWSHEASAFTGVARWLGPSSPSTIHMHPRFGHFQLVARQRRRPASPPRSPLSMCICIHCARVTNCSAYHFVETKHEQPHLSEQPTFTPRNGSPTIHVNVRTHRPNNSNNNDELSRLWREHATETANAVAGHGEQVYDLSPVTTTEYDVVACQDFVLDQGCWVRHMPEEIRKANPDFVPT